MLFLSMCASVGELFSFVYIMQIKYFFQNPEKAELCKYFFYPLCVYMCVRTCNL